MFGLDIRFRQIDQKIALDNEKKNASKIKLHAGVKGTKSRGDFETETINRHKIPKNVNYDQLSIQKNNRYGMSVQRKKNLRGHVGQSMNSTKYNTIAQETPSLNLPTLKSHKNINDTFDNDDYKTLQETKLSKLAETNGSR